MGPMPLLCCCQHDKKNCDPRAGFTKTVVNRSVTAVTGLTKPARLLKPTGNRPLTVPTKPSFSANRSIGSVYRAVFVEFENRYCSGFVNPAQGAETVCTNKNKLYFELPLGLTIVFNSAYWCSCCIIHVTPWNFQISGCKWEEKFDKTFLNFKIFPIFNSFTRNIA
jgi:hypothetical protein